MKYCFENAFLLYLNQIALTAQGFRPPKSVRLSIVLTWYQTALPNTVTFSRNCTGCIRSTILKLNHGLADSEIVKSEFTDAHLSKGYEFIAYLIKSKHNDMLKKTCAFLKRHTAARYLTRKRRYGLHSEIHYSKGLTEQKPDLTAKWPHLQLNMLYRLKIKLFVWRTSAINSSAMLLHWPQFCKHSVFMEIPSLPPAAHHYVHCKYTAKLVL